MPVLVAVNFEESSRRLVLIGVHLIGEGKVGNGGVMYVADV